MLDDLGEAVGNDWDSAGRALTSGDWELYLSGYTYHAPWSYARKYCENLNSNAWGLGVARSVADSSGDRHSLYITGFKDSWCHAEYHLGYMWMRYWPVFEPSGYLGIGYTVFLFARYDMCHYTPYPGVLPLVAIGGRKLKIYGTYIPPVGNFVRGNAAYFFMSVKL